MSKFDFSELDTIDIDDFFENIGVTTKKSGGDNVTIRDCPACGNNNWKVRFSRSKKSGHCFYASCEANFSLFSFTKSMIGGTGRETVEVFTQYLGKTFVREEIKQGIVVDGWEMPESIALPNKNAPCHEWLRKRKITEQTQQDFGLRYCESGYYKWTDDGRERKTSFAERVLLPVIDSRGIVQTFQGRATWDVNEDLGEKRYLFPTGLPGSSHFLYGENVAEGKSHIVLVEGPFDAMSVYQAFDGDEEFADFGVCATFGLSFGHGDLQGDDQLGALRRLKNKGLKEVTILWDAEFNAYNNALKACVVIAAAGIKTNIASLTEGKDPNEAGSREVKRAIRERKPINKMTIIKAKMIQPYKKN